jgi:diguanylate cyclase (GGDEF)-like protein
MPMALYQRMVRVVSYLFIASVAAIVTLTGDPAAPAVYVLLVAGIVLLVLFQDLLPTTSLARWRLPLEGAAAIIFVTLLVALTGGISSEYFFGYILLLGAGSLWAAGYGPIVLTAVSVFAYLLAVFVADGPNLYTIQGVGLVAINVVAMCLVTYIAWIFGREQRRARDEALRLSRFDSLTGLYSRSYFISTVEREIPRSARSGRPFAMLMFDLDGLKAANDRFGHEWGDRLLQAVADVVRGDVRVTDVAARYAGDEFVLLLPETDTPGALRVAEKIRVDISRLALPHNGSLIRTSASIGLVTYPEDGRTWVELMRRADLAMYEAKRRGRDQIVHYAREEQPINQPAMPPPTAAIAPTPTAELQAPTQTSTALRSDVQQPGALFETQTAAQPPPAAQPQWQQAPAPQQAQQLHQAQQQQQTHQEPAHIPAQQPVTTGVRFDIPPESPFPPPWEKSGG